MLPKGLNGLRNNNQNYGYRRFPKEKRHYEFKVKTMTFLT